MSTFLFYVSGHGYGHARRTAAVIRALLRRRPDADVHVRTAAAARIFSPLPAERVRPSDLDAGMAEDDALTINAERSLRRLEALAARREAILAEEAAAVRSVRPGLMVSDVPFLAGDVAEAAGVPCVAVSNFSWDWIYEPLFAQGPSYAVRYAPLRPVVRGGYAKMKAALRLPFGGLSDAFREVVPVPLVAGRSERERSEVLARAGLDAADRRPRVLVGMRGGLPDVTVAAAAAGAPDFLFLVPGDAHRGMAPSERGPSGGTLPNLLPVVTGPELDFSDLVSVCDVVVSKLGYGTVAECLAGGARMLWPRRTGFREDDVMIAELPRYLPTREIPRGDFGAGRWGRWLRELMAEPTEREPIRVDGAEVCAEILGGMSASSSPLTPAVLSARGRGRR
jgi:L-arabinokinase